MNDDFVCPLCGGRLEPHNVVENECIYELGYCCNCEADVLFCGMGESRILEPHDTRPIDAIKAREATRHAQP